ncbi:MULTISPECIES: hypothetical protein [unclassified Streptomyces]|uniref:hypothetical protein n=1 Tax=unclassified Streptomyces TaxID=2593676 RepID=UPI00381AF80C
MIIRIKKITFATVPSSELNGRACHVAEGPGWLAARVGLGEMRDELLRDLTRLYESLLVQQALWVQNWDGDIGRLDRPSENRGIAEAFWRPVPGDDLPTGLLCAPLAVPGRLGWGVHEDYVSAKLLAEANVYLHRMVSDGLYLERWE